MTGFDHLKNGPVTLSPRERNDIETLRRQLNEVDRLDPTNTYLIAVTPERRALLQLVLMTGLTSIDAGCARYTIDDD